MIWIILHIIEIFFWLLLAASGAYILFFALVSMLWKRPISPLSAYLEGQIRSMREPRQFTFLVLYPAYNEDRVIVNSVHTFLGQYYPYKGFHVAVISDHMQPETNEKLAQLPITLLQPIFEKSSKAKAMQYALQQIQGEYDYVVILDADNVVESDFLAKLNPTTTSPCSMVSARKSTTPSSARPITASVSLQHSSALACASVTSGSRRMSTNSPRQVRTVNLKPFCCAREFISTTSQISTSMTRRFPTRTTSRSNAYVG